MYSVDPGHGVKKEKENLVFCSQYFTCMSAQGT